MSELTKTELVILNRRAEEHAMAARAADDQAKYRRLMDLADAAEAAAKVL